MAEVRRDKHGRPDRTHLLATSGSDVKNPRMLPITVLRDMSKVERRALLVTEYVHTIFDEKGRERKIDKKYEKEPWIELKDQELIKKVFIHVAANKLDFIDDHRFFVTKNCPILNDVEDLVAKKKELLDKNIDVIKDAMIKNKSWSMESIEAKTFYEVEAIINQYKKAK